MTIQFERSGGLFPGLRLAATVDTAKLPPGEAEGLHQLVEASGFFNLPQALTTSEPGPDRFHYKITISDGVRDHTVEAPEAAVPAALRPLLDRLTALARAAGKNR